MRRSFITLYALAATALTAVAQPRFTSNTETYDFGQIEWKHPVTVQYSITNTGDRPLVLTEVEPDCACSVAQWTKTPIAPGAKGTVNVTFDAEALGHFNKSVAIYCNAQPHLVYLKFNGEVVREIKDFTKTHPYLIGQIRIDKNSLDFPDVQAGEKPVMHIGVVNLSDRPYEPVYLARFGGDKVGDENEIPVSAILLPDFSGMSDTEKANAPVVNLSIKDIDMSTALAKKSKARQDIVITNTGRSPLQISKLQVFHPAVGAGLKKSVLKPGESTRLRVTVVKRNIGKKRRHLRLLMITNDPMQPKVEINIKAK